MRVLLPSTNGARFVTYASPKVIVFTGLPGTGKSTLADWTASQLGAPAFAGDWLLGALKPAAKVLAQLDRATYLELYRCLLRSLIMRQLILEQPPSSTAS